MSSEPARGKKWPWWVWLVFILFPIPFGFGWKVTVAFLGAFAVVMWAVARDLN